MKIRISFTFAKVLFSLPFLLFFLILAPFFTQMHAASKGSVVQLGDSLTAGMYGSGGIVDKYKALGWDPVIPGNNPSGSGGCDGFIAGFPCHGLSGGPQPDGLTIVEQQKDAISKATAIVVEFGTNITEADTAAFDQAVEKMIFDIRTINPNIRILWVNIAAVVNASQYSARNRVLADRAASMGFSIIDWFHLAYPTGDPTNISPNLTSTNGWIPSDDVHPSGSGYQALADLVSKAVDGQSPSNNAPGGGTGSSSTSCVITRVGNPQGPAPTLPPACISSGTGGPVDASSCPIPNGPIICGSAAHPSNNCGHCGLNYGHPEFCPPNPGMDGTPFAIDVGAPDGSPVYLPQVNGHMITWTYIGEEGGATEAIQKFAGTDQTTGDKYYLQFHHTGPGSGSQGTHNSGEKGANICSGCDENHVHVQIATGSNRPATGAWLDSAEYFCKQ